MPEESKKSHDKKKNDPKDQRKPRQRHQQGGDKKAEKKTEEPKSAPKVTVPQKPVYESPPPEFFKSLKRETDEILKITEEENQKYKKKEIKSNWTKYEMPIETYEEIDEQENMGADYEKLIQAPLSIGGHFQFKHEKSWDVTTGPSLYDKYFAINMEDLNLAICTIPFHERNSIDLSIFTDTDILTMNNRTGRFKQKYFNDKSFATPEIETQDKILNSLRGQDVDENLSNTDIVISTKLDSINDKSSKPEPGDLTPIYDKHIEFNVNPEINTVVTNNFDDEKAIEEFPNENDQVVEFKEDIDITFKEIKAEPRIDAKVEEVTEKPLKVEEPKIDVEHDYIAGASKNIAKESKIEFMKAPKTVAPVPKVVEPPKVTKKDPVIESPEDLEKWLDDFLDG